MRAGCDEGYLFSAMKFLPGEIVNARLKTYLKVEELLFLTLLIAMKSLIARQIAVNRLHTTEIYLF